MSNHSKYPKEAGIYKLTCISNGKIYIGKTVNIYNRIGGHRRCCNRTNGRYLIERALIKHGWDAFTVEVLEIFKNFDKLKDNDVLLDIETNYIELFDSTKRDIGYNICKFSNDCTGIPKSPFTEEHKKKLSQAKLGTKLSDKHKESLRKVNIGNSYALGIKHSEERKGEIRQFMSGRTLSEETKEKIRKAKLGKPRSDEIKEKIRQTTKANIANRKNI